MDQILILIFFYFLILFSILGYGRIFTLINSNYQAGSFDGLLGLAVLIFISYLTNLLFPHNYLHNSIIILMGLIIFAYDFYKNFLNRKKELRDLTIIFSIIFIGLLMYKNHDDFFYYHFPYTLILVEFEKIFGLGNLNHGFRTPSSIFYLNSIFYLPGIKYFLLNGGAVYIFGFSNFVLYNLIRDHLNKKEFNHILFLSLLSILYINTTFARLSEHGTDRSALILIFLMSIFYLKSLNFEKKQLSQRYFNNYYTKLSILFAIIISLKAFYIIYSVIFLLWFFQIRKIFKFNDLLKLVLRNYYTYLILTLFLFTIFTIFTNTGCLIYPARFTCFENLSWAISLDQVDQMYLWYEQWSKGGAGPNFRVENPEIYVSNFNWVSNWFEIYFFNKVSDNILVIMTISIIVILLFRFNQNEVEIKKYDYKFFYLLILLLFVEWFYNHPALRYGGYTLLALIFFIPVSIYLSKYKFDYFVSKKKTYFILLLVIIIFVSRNINRIDKEYKQYGYNPFDSAFFYLNKDGFILNDLVKSKYTKKMKNTKYLIIDK
tara:strand:- start:1249 stop:2883 length:1635 start_codon:yes stop_codon:yes gene_type:complete